MRFAHGRKPSRAVGGAGSACYLQDMKSTHSFTCGLRGAALALVLAGLVGAALLVKTGDRGGQLVYSFRVGTSRE